MFEKDACSDKRAFTGILVLSALVMMLSGCAFNGDYIAEDGAAEHKDGARIGSSGPALSEKDLLENMPVIKPVYLDPEWEWAGLSAIDEGCAVLYTAGSDRKDIVVGVNAGHGTVNGESYRTFCHPDKTPKITSGSNPAGALTATAISTGMIFYDGTYEADVALECSKILKDMLLERGYDVLMLRNEKDVRLDNVARCVIANNNADILISLHWDGDGLDYDKGCFYVPVPDEIKEMEPVASNWREHERLGRTLITGLKSRDCLIYNGKIIPQELTQICYSTIPAALVELGNASSEHDNDALERIARGLLAGVDSYFGYNVTDKI